MGGAAALELKDMAFTQYREPGILMWRDFGIQVCTDLQHFVSTSRHDIAYFGIIESLTQFTTRALCCMLACWAVRLFHVCSNAIEQRLLTTKVPSAAVEEKSVGVRPTAR